MIETSFSPSASSSAWSTIAGLKSCCAMIVGTNADAMTTVTSSVYWVLLIS